jgi:nitronate monooxygenase
MSHAITVTRSLTARYPWVSNPFIVGAPMAVIASPKLAVTISQAGGFGFIGPGGQPQDIIPHLEEASSLVKTARTSSTVFSSIPSTNSRLPIGVGFLLWRDDLDIAADAVSSFKPWAVWLYAPSQSQQLEDWSRRFREVSPETQIWIQIGTVKEANALMKSSEQPDVIVVQGSESGGHGRAHDGMGLMTLLPEVADAIKASAIPLFAAGGIADGRQVAAVMCLGASGAVMGTRFIASNEARVPRGYKDEVVCASDGASSTTRTLLYNHLGGQYGWPEPYMPRMIINQSFVDHQEGKAFADLKKLFDEANKRGDEGYGLEGRRATYAGAAIGLIHEIKHAADVVLDIQKEALERLTSLQFERSQRT